VNLPGPFIQTIENAFGPRGRDFLQSLPDLVAEAGRRWQLTDVQPVSNLSYNYVATARRAGREVVLKLGVPDREFISEIVALRLFDGRGAARLLEADEDRSMFLLERLRPGELMAALRDDAQATHIAADVLLALWRPAPANDKLIQLSDWFKGFAGLRQRFEGGTGPLNRRMVERAEAAVKGFFGEPYVPTLMHGDLHHFNILSSERGWLAIDPKGVIGPAAYEVGPLLINPWLVTGLHPETPQLLQNRIAILSEHLGFEKERIREWGLAHALLSAWWSLADNEDWQPASKFAEILAEARL
jgi:streptomycin 6-kinase